MLDLWHCHRTSLWLCMNMKMSSKHLYNEHDMMFQTCIVRYFNSLLNTLLLHGTRYVRKYSNSICLTRHGSYGRLQDGGKVSPQTSLKCHPTETIARHFFKSSTILETKPWRHKVISCFLKMWQSWTVSNLTPPPSKTALAHLFDPLHILYTPDSTILCTCSKFPPLLRPP